MGWYFDFDFDFDFDFFWGGELLANWEVEGSIRSLRLRVVFGVFCRGLGFVEKVVVNEGKRSVLRITTRGLLCCVFFFECMEGCFV